MNNRAASFESLHGGNTDEDRGARKRREAPGHTDLMISPEAIDEALAGAVPPTADPVGLPDITGMLRALANLHNPEDVEYNQTIEWRAADTITSLRARVAELERERDEARAAFKISDTQSANNVIAELVEKLASLRAAELVEALEWIESKRDIWNGEVCDIALAALAKARSA